MMADGHEVSCSTVDMTKVGCTECLNVGALSPLSCRTWMRVLVVRCKNGRSSTGESLLEDNCSVVAHHVDTFALHLRTEGECRDSSTFCTSCVVSFALSIVFSTDDSDDVLLCFELGALLHFCRTMSLKMYWSESVKPLNVGSSSPWFGQSAPPAQTRGGLNLMSICVVKWRSWKWVQLTSSGCLPHFVAFHKRQLEHEDKGFMWKIFHIGITAQGNGISVHVYG